MTENIENNDWISEAPTLAAMDKRNPFDVPDGYFNNLNELVFSSIFVNEFKQKTNLNTFEVPQHYFEELTARIQTHITLAEMPKAESTFGVPENYFDTLQSRINNKIEALEPKKQAKVVSLWSKNLFKYASAACFLLISSFGFYLYQNQGNSVSQIQSAEFANEQMLYDIDESTIIDHLETESTAKSNAKTNSVSDTEMENYILSHFSSSDLAQELNN
ncbi:hypothetical protein [Pedobacter nototheniae]|uniref:hypothetical protein n=1 Tax=Pedobacter nototheniae TaxID=2488994 RepID=UPI002930A070|nr:hypothetical protein [Pedobacter nototheniae]